MRSRRLGTEILVLRAFQLEDQRRAKERVQREVEI